STGEIPFSIGDRGATSFSTAGGLGSAVVGYGRIQPDNGSSAPPGLAIFGFRHDGILVTEAGVPAAPAIQSGRFYAELNGPVNTGVAIANPNEESVQVSFYFTGATSLNPGPGTIVIGANSQIAAFLNQTPFGVTAPFAGTFSFTASAPVFVTALRGFTNERADFLITTLPVSSLGSPANETLYFPHFADGGGWTTQVVLVNPTDTLISGNASFFDQGSESSP